MTKQDHTEQRRLNALHEYDIWGTDQEQVFDDITMLASTICQTPIALISLLNEDTQWFKSKVGTEVASTPRELAFCNYAILTPDLMLVEDARDDERFASNPLVTGDPNIRFYSGAPIVTPDGYALGTLCVIDDKPRTLTIEQQNNLQALSRQVMRLFEGRRLLIERRRLQNILDQEREIALEKETQARKLAEQSNRLKDDFLATVSHELRTPLNAILGWATMMDSGKLDSNGMSRGIDTILRSAKSQAKLIEDLLDVSRIISGNLRLDMKKVHVESVVKTALESVALMAQAKTISIDSEIQPGLPTLTADPERLTQIFWNLLSNAIKFTAKNGQIKVRLTKNDTEIIFSVSDNGQGIPAEFLPHVFDRFRQADGSSTRRSGGLGLGLAIVSHLVEMHGGFITAESEGEAKGSTFRVVLPFQPNRSIITEKTQFTTSAFLENEDILTDVSLEGVTVAVIDDEEDSSSVVREVLTLAGAEVFVCKKSAEFLEIVQTKRPSVLISDIGMPDEDGYTLIKKVRALPVELGGQTPAIALTAYARVEDRVKALSLGFQMFIPKPLEPAELVAAVSSIAFLGKRIF